MQTILKSPTIQLALRQLHPFLDKQGTTWRCNCGLRSIALQHLSFHLCPKPPRVDVKSLEQHGLTYRDSQVSNCLRCGLCGVLCSRERPHACKHHLLTSFLCDFSGLPNVLPTTLEAAQAHSKHTALHRECGGHVVVLFDAEEIRDVPELQRRCTVPANCKHVRAHYVIAHKTPLDPKGRGVLRALDEDLAAEEDISPLSRKHPHLSTKLVAKYTGIIRPDEYDTPFGLAMVELTPTQTLHAFGSRTLTGYIDPMEVGGMGYLLNGAHPLENKRKNKVTCYMAFAKEGTYLLCYDAAKNAGMEMAFNYKAKTSNPNHHLLKIKCRCGCNGPILELESL